jgi:hypothetical protein
VAFTAGSLLLSLGPFIRVAGLESYVPTPWAVLRYLPIVGAARVPTRFSILVMLGAGALLTVALSGLRARSRRPWIPVAALGCCLALELVPAPRTVYPVVVPPFYDRIRADPRPVRVLTLPFGLRDGMASYGDFWPSTQFYQTVHEKPLLGGYLSRLPRRGLDSYWRSYRLGVLMELSAGRRVGPERMERAIERAHLYPPRLDIGYVVVHTGRVSPQLLSFARAAFDLQLVAESDGQALYRTPLASGASARRSLLDGRRTSQH